MVDLKNIFMDIMFDDNPEDVNENDKDARVKKDESSIKASDILYNNSNTSVFIDIDENPTKKEEPIKDNNNDKYEMSAQISPIFGLIGKEKKKAVNVSPEITESQTTKPVGSHLDIITSPIYGYGNKEDAMDNNYDVKGINEDEDDQLHQLFDQGNVDNKDVMNDEILDEEEISLFRLFGDNK